MEKQVKIEEGEVDASPQVIQSYKDAIQKAMEIAVDKNLETISGVTYWINVQQNQRWKNYGSINQCKDCAFVLGHMIRTKCEKCEFYLFSAPLYRGEPFVKVDFNNDTLLQGIQRCQSKSKELSSACEMVGQTINNVLLQDKIKGDNIVILIPRQCEFRSKILFYGQQVSFGQNLKSKNCFLINGMSDNVMKYIAQAGKINQLDDVVAFSQELKSKQQVENQNNDKAQIDQAQQFEIE
ncbi:unnamed protein product [Paramecium octaurelia]|uniref:Uncharacterized protein n=1 Tax=Paramecium octaurelia TaxID=43137 RepID=A0A8S1WBN7_PAROT|nr:unnamed protein product [Paramecium octaurelia]